MPPKDTEVHGPLIFSTDGGETMRPLGKITEAPDLSGIYIEGEDGYEMVGRITEDMVIEGSFTMALPAVWHK